MPAPTDGPFPGSDEAWGPSHQYLPPPERGKGVSAAAIAKFGALALGCLLGGASVYGALIRPLLAWAVGIAVLVAAVRVWHQRPLCTWSAARSRAGRHEQAGAGARAASTTATDYSQEAVQARRMAERVRGRCARMGGGAYLGLTGDGGWVSADPEHAVMVLGPPRSGKTSAIVIPSILAAPGPVVSTASKPDVLEATWRARAEIGEAWLYDPAGDFQKWPHGVRRLCWSPVPAAATWDGALLMARAMAACGQPGKGTINEHHWRERSTALLAPLLHAAHITNRQMADVLTWVLRTELEDPCKALEDHGSQTAADVLAGIMKTEERERSSIMSATAGVLAAYNADAVRRNSAHPNFDPDRFAGSTDTIYITAPAHKQALCAPLIAGLLEQIRHATYRRAPELLREGAPPVYMALDEAANIAPIHDLPALVSEAGGQHLHILIGLQDLSQARKRWGTDADGFLSLFQTKVILSGIADTKTLEAISVCLGEYDRQTASQTLGRSDPSHRRLLERHKWTDSHNVGYQTQRQRVLSPGEIAQLPPARALHLRGTSWQLIRTTRWYRAQPWAVIARA